MLTHYVIHEEPDGYYIVDINDRKCSKIECEETGCSFPFCHRHYGIFGSYEQAKYSLDEVNAAERRHMVSKVVPIDDLDKVEASRIALYALFEKEGWLDDPFMLIKLSEITTPLWIVSHKNYDEVT